MALVLIDNNDKPSSYDESVNCIGKDVNMIHLSFDMSLRDIK